MGGGQEAEGGEVNVFWGAMGRCDNKRKKKRQRMRAAAATTAGLCNINLRRADQKAGELNCVLAESERWRGFFTGCTMASSAAQDGGNARQRVGGEVRSTLE